VLPALHVSFFDQILQPVSNGSPRRVVAVFEFDHEIGDDVTPIRHHLLQHLIG
jgi:hypothetical protein